MIRVENQCVSCGLPCMGETCKYRNIPEIICDKCGDECYEAYEVNGEQLCESCLLSTFPKIVPENAEEYMQ